jgi:hypothetical protein
MYAGAYVLGPCLRAGCAHAVWAGGGSRSDTLGAGRLCLATRVGGGLWSRVSQRAGRSGAVLGGGANAWASGGPGGTVVLSRVCVDAWSGAASCDSFRV